jgi:uncharacterized protein YciI
MAPILRDAGDEVAFGVGGAAAGGSVAGIVSKSGITPRPEAPSMTNVYAILWRYTEPAEKFGALVPSIMAWLKDLRRRGILVACGGGGFADADGGLTIIRAAGPEEAAAEMARCPQTAFGTMELFEWGVYFADLSVPKEF